MNPELPPLYKTMPPPNTHSVLMRMGLVSNLGFITPAGMIVRNYLENENGQ